MAAIGLAGGGGAAVASGSAATAGATTIGDALVLLGAKFQGVLNFFRGVGAAFTDQPQAGGRAINEQAAVNSVERVAEILRPGGAPLGAADTSQGVRFLEGGTAAATQLFKNLTAGGTVTEKTSEFVVVAVKGVGDFTYRIVSSTKGVVATIDIRVAGVGIKRLKFTP